MESCGATPPGVALGDSGHGAARRQQRRATTTALLLPAALVLAHGLRGARCGVGLARREPAGGPSSWLRRPGVLGRATAGGAWRAQARALRLRGSGEEDGQGEGSAAAAATMDPARMKRALEKLDEMRAASEINQRKKAERLNCQKSAPAWLYIVNVPGH